MTMRAKVGLSLGGGIIGEPFGLPSLYAGMQGILLGSQAGPPARITADGTISLLDRIEETDVLAIEPNHPKPVAGPGDEVELRYGDRRSRVRGLGKYQSPEVLKVNLLAGRGEDFHVDTLGLYAARQRGAFIKAAATELSVEERVVKNDLGRVLLYGPMTNFGARGTVCTSDDTLALLQRPTTLP